MKNEYINNEMCKKCGGRCCLNMGCHYSPDDFKDLSYEALKREIEKGFISIDWWEGNPFDEYDDSIKRAYYLRIRNEDANIIDPAFIGKCMLLTDNGCPLSFNKRPKGARLLAPKEGGCKSYYTKQQSAKDWFKYNDILTELSYYFEGM